MYANKRLSAAKQIKPPGWFMLVSVLALIWNLGGLASFWSDFSMSPIRLNAMPEAQRALILGTPSWAWVAYGLAVIAGSLGALMLVMRQRVAVPLFMASTAGVLVQMFHSFFVGRAAGAGGLDLVLPLAIITVSVGLLVLASKARNHGWLP